MSFIQSLGQLRAPVSTYVNLPITENVLGDLRIVSDVGSLYTWMNPSSSGSLADWQRVTVSSYNELRNRPTVSILDIDNATTNIRNIYLNFVYLFYMSMVAISQNVMKMFEGLLDSFVTNDGIDGAHTSGMSKLSLISGSVAVNYLRNNFDGSLDTYTKLLIHGRNLNISNNTFLEALYNDIIPQNVTGDSVIKKFGNKSLVFNAASNSFLSAYYLNSDGDCFKVNGLDFTWDFWVRPDTDNAETLIVSYNFNHDDGINFKLEKLADKTVKASLRGCTDYTYDNQWIPANPISYDVTSVNTISAANWYHIALVRSNGYLKLFINGNLEGTSSVSDNQNIINYKQDMSFPFYQGSPCFKIGAGFTGRMEEIRFSKGIARWTSNFSVPTVEYNTPTQSAPCNNMVIQSQGYEANAVPSSVRAVIFEQNAVISYNPEIDTVLVPNTDIKFYVSRDGGTTWTQASDLKIEFDIYQEDVWGSIYNNINFLVGTVDLSSQPSGKEMVYKITTHNNKDILIRSVAMNWK